jgi:hypothetical protein
MKQADNIYERRLHEARVQEELKNDEELTVYAYSKSNDEFLTIFVQNNGEEDIEIVRYWTNDNKTEISTPIPSSNLIELVTKSIQGVENQTLQIKITTASGNVFSSSLGSTVYSSVNGWYTPSLAVCVTIINDAGQYNIKVTNNSITFGEYQSSGIDHDDITKTFLVSTTYNKYNVIVKKKIGGDWINLDVVSPVQVPSVSGNPVVYVVADGT